MTILQCGTNISKSKFTFISDHFLQFLSTFFYAQNPARFGPPYHQTWLISSDRVCWLEAISRDGQMLNGRACIVSSYCDANRAGRCQTILTRVSKSSCWTGKKPATGRNRNRLHACSVAVALLSGKLKRPTATSRDRSFRTTDLIRNTYILNVFTTIYIL